MGAIRDILFETMALRQEEQRWVVTADAVSSMGFDTRRKGGSVVGYEVKGVWAPVQALKNMDAKNLSIQLGKAVPEGVTANDMLKVLKTLQPVTTKNGTVLVPEDGLQEKVAANSAMACAERYRDKGIELVVTPQSSSRFASIFGSILAKHIGARHVEEGVVKAKKGLRLNMPQHVKDTQTGKDAVRAVDRWERTAAAGRQPSLRSTFKPSMRQHVSGFMEPGPNVSPWVGEGTKVLIADDVVTTGSTHTDSVRALEELGFVVVGRVAAVKEQSSHR